MDKCALAISLAAVLAALCSSAIAEELLRSDFETGPDGWTTGGPNDMQLMNIGGAHGYVMADADIGSDNSLSSYQHHVLLPTELVIDLDYQITGVPEYQAFYVGFHLWGSNTDPSAPPAAGPLDELNGYYIAWVNYGGLTGEVLQLLRRTDPAFVSVLDEIAQPIDTINVHHLRITDCGCGRLDIFIDDMTTPILSVDDTANYIGRNFTYLGVYAEGSASGWFDNVLVDGPLVPEPTSLLLLAAAGLAGLRHSRLHRRRTC